MSESPREQIGKAQAELVASLRERGSAPEGFDAKRLDLTAIVLERKRARANEANRRELRTILARAWLRFRAVIRRFRAG